MEEMNLNNIMEENFEACEALEPVGGKAAGKVIGGVLGVAGLAVAAWYYTKDMRKQRQIAKLEKEGYTIIKPEIDETDEDSDVE